MAKPFITIIGLGYTGTSLALALRKEPGDFDIVGHDKNADSDAEAKRLKAIDRTEWNLHRAVEGSSLVVLAMPLDAIEETLGHIAEDVAPNSLVLALNTLLQPLIESAAKQMPNHSRFVAGHIIHKVGASGAITADAWDGATFALATSASTDPAAIELASDFAERVGAQTHFTDPLEHDGVMALVEQLPQFVGTALVSLSSGGNGWRESRQMAGKRYAQSTDLGGSADQLFQSFVDNRENLARRITDLQNELDRWLDLLKSDPQPGEEHPLKTALAAAVDERTQWEAQARTAKWEETNPGAAAAQEGPGLLRQLFVGNMFKKKQPPSNGGNN